MDCETTNIILEKFADYLKKQTPKEVGRLLQKLERDRFEYEEAKHFITMYERNDLHNDLMIQACEKILKVTT